MKSKMNLNSEHLLELAALEINTIWRMQYFFWYCLNTTVCEYWHSKCISTEICLAALNVVGGKLKVRFHLPAKQLFILTWEKKLWLDISFSSTCFYHYWEHLKNDNKIDYYLT